MAQRRFISRRLTESDKIGKLQGDDRARFLYVALLPYTDREGRINANPLMLKASTLEGFEYSAQEIAAALDALAGVGLIDLFETPRHRLVMQYTKFDEFNKPHDKEAASDLPASGTPTTASDALRKAIADVMGEPPDSSGNGTGNGQESSAVSERFSESLSESRSEREKPSSTSAPAVSAQPAEVGQARRESVYDPFLAAWNDHCGDLPKVHALNQHRRAGLDKIRKEHGEAAVALLADAAACVALDKFWRDKGYNLDNLLRGGKVLERAEKHRHARDSAVCAASDAQRDLSGGDLLDLDVPLNGKWGDA